MSEPTVIDVVVTTATRHPQLPMAIAEIGRLAEAVHQAIGGKTAIEALLCVYMNMALDQVGLAEVQDALQRALEQLPRLDRARQLLPPAGGTA
jgi:hypothetical protein